MPLDASVLWEALGHRGPDDRGQATLGAVQLVHVRLAIVDLDHGAQPMRRGGRTLAFNGEIYNHLELRRRFDLKCRTGSDTETLLALHERLGDDCLRELDGMFAFALHDADAGSLLLARDRLGEKPLYVWRRGARFAFASELNALAAALPLEIDDAAVRDFLACGVFLDGATPYVDVAELPAGCLARIDCAAGSVVERRWFDLEAHHVRAADERRPGTPSEAEALHELETVLRESVQRQLLSSDVEVGAFLSGGIDSGLVAAFAAAGTDVLRTFTVGFEGRFDETPLAAASARALGTRHEVLAVDYAHLVDDLPGIVGNYGEPVCDDSVVPVWYVARAAADRVKVVLTGDGADELFGGYRRCVPYRHLPLFRAGRGVPGADRLRAALPAPGDKHGPWNYLWRLVDLAGAGGVERYLASTTALGGDWLVRPGPPRALERLHADLAGLPVSDLRRLAMMDARTLLSGAYLPKVDIGSMAHSLETRCPFLGREVVAFAASLPDRMKVRGTTTKWALRELAARHLPAEIVTAPKRGFETPLAEWMEGRLAGMVAERLLDPDAFVRRFVAPATLVALVDGTFPLPRLRLARVLWTLLCTELWHARFVELQANVR